MKLLVIDDDPPLRRTLRTALESMGHTVRDAAGGAAALRHLDAAPCDLAFLDLKLGPESGLDLLPRLLASAPQLGVVLMTAYATIPTAVEAMRLGAFDYIPKPFTPDQLRLTLGRFQTVRGLRQQLTELRQQVAASQPTGDLTTLEPAVRAALDVAFRVAPSDATLLIRGESGTGKGVLARAVHARSARATGPFVVVHCPSLSADLLESELFGHAKGAYTGAIDSTEGKVAAANGGTLFLDEIGDLPLALQPKLLRFLQDREYERVGEAKTRTADVRLVAATNRPLEDEVRAGRFREDLLYRLNVIEVTLPPLRERPKDLPTLTETLLTFFARQTGRGPMRLAPEAAEAMAKHAWPGNLRELRNAIERGVLLTTGPVVGVEDLPAQVGSRSPARVEFGGRATMEAVESEHIRRVLGGTASLEDAAAVLGIDPSTLYRKRKKLGL